MKLIWINAFILIICLGMAWLWLGRKQKVREGPAVPAELKAASPLGLCGIGSVGSDPGRAPGAFPPSDRGVGRAGPCLGLAGFQQDQECPELDPQDCFSSCPAQPNNPSVVQTFWGLWSCSHSLGSCSSARHPLGEKPFLISHLTLPSPSPAVPIPVSILSEMLSPLLCIPGRREMFVPALAHGECFPLQTSVCATFQRDKASQTCLPLPACPSPELIPSWQREEILEPPGPPLTGVCGSPQLCPWPEIPGEAVGGQQLGLELLQAWAPSGNHRPEPSQCPQLSQTTLPTVRISTSYHVPE